MAYVHDFLEYASFILCSSIDRRSAPPPHKVCTVRSITGSNCFTVVINLKPRVGVVEFGKCVVVRFYFRWASLPPSFASPHSRILFFPSPFPDKTLMFEIRLNKIPSTKAYLDPRDGGQRKKFSGIKSNKLSLAMGCVRVKLTYEGRTFRRTVDPRSFTWAQFLAW